MDKPFLILHKVRGLPAFDVAIQMEMEGQDSWWIIPTSGHRAYPYWYISIQDLNLTLRSPPEGLRDHYEVSPTKPAAVRKAAAQSDLSLDDLGL